MSRRVSINAGFGAAFLICAGIAAGLIWFGVNLLRAQPDVASATCNGEPMSATSRCVLSVNGTTDSAQTAEQVAEASAGQTHFWGWVLIGVGGLSGVFALGAAAQTFD
jgi:hypothetical protein